MNRKQLLEEFELRIIQILNEKRLGSIINHTIKGNLYTTINKYFNYLDSEYGTAFQKKGTDVIPIEEILTRGDEIFEVHRNKFTMISNILYFPETIDHLIKKISEEALTIDIYRGIIFSGIPPPFSDKMDLIDKLILSHTYLLNLRRFTLKAAYNLNYFPFRTSIVNGKLEFSKELDEINKYCRGLQKIENNRFAQTKQLSGHLNNLSKNKYNDWLHYDLKLENQIRKNYIRLKNIFYSQIPIKDSVIQKSFEIAKNYDIIFNLNINFENIFYKLYREKGIFTLFDRIRKKFNFLKETKIAESNTIILKDYYKYLNA